jgi:MFS family permease
MMSAMGVGSLVGALVIASLGNVKHRGFVLVSSGILSGSILLGFSAMSYWAPVYLVAVGFMVLIGLLQAGRMTLNSSLMMEYADQQYRGRVMSILTLSMALMPAGVIPVTLMADHFGAPLSLGTMATLLIIVACTVLLASPRLRHLD